jgi:CheY-like chemotaxis protein
MALLLMIDDNPQSRRYMERIIRHRTAHVINFAEDSRQAIERIAEQRPDVIFLDLFLPGIDGFQLFKILRKHPATASIPIIIHTAVPLDQITQIKMRRVRHDGFLEFPVEATALNEMIERALRRHTVERPWQPPPA